jgi:hypothetical protein
MIDKEQERYPIRPIVHSKSTGMGQIQKAPSYIGIHRLFVFGFGIIRANQLASDDLTETLWGVFHNILMSGQYRFFRRWENATRLSSEEKLTTVFEEKAAQSSLHLVYS